MDNAVNDLNLSIQNEDNCYPASHRFWLSSFLTGGKLAVRVNTPLSIHRNVSSALAQVRALSPLSFCIYTDDLLSLLEGSAVCTFVKYIE